MFLPRHPCCRCCRLLILVHVLVGTGGSAKTFPSSGFAFMRMSAVGGGGGVDTSPQSPDVDAATATSPAPSGSSRVFLSTPAKRVRRLVRDCMTPNPATVTPETSVDEAIATLLALGISGAPVVDGSGEVVGIVSSSDFLLREDQGCLLPIGGWGESAQEVEELIGAAKKIVGQNVADVMTREFLSIGPGETMRNAADLMARTKKHRLVVVDDEGKKVVGILSRSDVMRDVLNTVRAALPMADEGVVEDEEDERGRP